MKHGWSQGGQGWVAHQQIFDAVFAPVTGAVTGAAGWQPGERWLDVGCGAGTLLEVGAGAGVQMVGADISPAMVQAARRRVPAATVLQLDAESDDLLEAAPGAPFAGIISRFGVMFFSDPVRAFGNLRAATAAGGRMAFACWRSREENPIFTLGTDVLTARLSEPTPTPDPGAPGPTAFADATVLHGLLAAGGWRDIDIAPFDFVCDYGMDGSDGVEERLAVILATSSGRTAQRELEPALGPDGWADLLDDVRTDLRRHRVDGVVRCPGATWVVTARAG